MMAVCVNNCKGYGRLAVRESVGYRCFCVFGGVNTKSTCPAIVAGMPNKSHCGQGRAVEEVPVPNRDPVEFVVDMRGHAAFTTNKSGLVTVFTSVKCGSQAVAGSAEATRAKGTVLCIVHFLDNPELGFPNGQLLAHGPLGAQSECVDVTNPARTYPWPFDRSSSGSSSQHGEYWGDFDPSGLRGGGSRTLER